jgi:sugar-specific transcriptional regulator TrmB
MNETSNYFQKFGLTKYESAVLLTLSANGELSAQDTSKKSEVPYTKIYSALNSLNDKELINILAGRPKKYSAMSVKRVFNRLIKTKEKEVAFLKKRAIEEIPYVMLQVQTL